MICGYCSSHVHLVLGTIKVQKNLRTIGMQITDKLKGNPLAAVTAGALLREHLSVDHWSNILKTEKWKSLGLHGGIMPALKLSYDELPYHLQQCFSYCSIFPDKYRFLGKDLIYMWISLGFVNCTHLSKRLEEIGWEYLNDLVNLGFFEQFEEQLEVDEGEEEESSLGSKFWYSMCGLMHDFGRIVSRTGCGTIDGLHCNNMLPTIRHLSIVTNSAYNKDWHGNICRNDKFEENLRNTITSVSKLRTLVLLGNFDSFFLQLLQDIFQKAHNLRLLKMSATSNDFNTFLCGMANPSHIRYLQCEPMWWDGALPQILIKLFHLQVLDVGFMPSIPDGMHNLVSLRHLVAAENPIASVGSMTSLQEIHDFKVQFCSEGFEISQLQFMNELVQLGVCQLANVRSREEAHGAGLRYKEHLEKLRLSWKEHISDAYTYEDEGKELSTMDVSGPSSDPSVDTAREVLEGLEPHMNLKHLHISGYNGTTSPTWLSSNLSVISLRTLHLVDCGGWRILPSLESLPFLTKLKLSSMREVIKVLVPSLEELVLITMPKLVRCSSTSVGGLSSSLRVRKIENCKALKAFDLFEIEQMPWLTGLRKLVLEGCPHLKVLNPLPPSTSCSELFVDGVSVLSSMKGSSSEHLCIGCIDEYRVYECDDYSDQLRILDETFLAFHNLGNLKSMEIYGQKNLRSFSFEGFSRLVSLKSLKINCCEDLFSSDMTPGHTLEDLTAFPSLESLIIDLCRIAGKWLSLILQHAPHLEELNLNLIQVPAEVEENSLRNHLSDGEDSSSRDPNDARAARMEDLYIPLNLASSLKKITMESCPCLTFTNWSDEGFSVFASLEKLTIRECPDLLSPLVHKDGSDDRAHGRWLHPTSLQELDINSYRQRTLQLCFQSDITSLRNLSVRDSPFLESLKLHSCTALEKLEIVFCWSLTALEGLQFLGRLTHLNISGCPGLVHEDGNDDQVNGRWLLPTSLRQLKINNSHSQETLQPCFPTYSTSLETLEVRESPGLQSIQLGSCTALEELTIGGCGSLTALEGLQCLGRLRNLNIYECPGLPPCLESFSSPDYRLCSPLERLEIDDPFVLTTSFCKHLTSLQRLCLRSHSLQLKRLTDEQEQALVLPKSLQELEFHSFALKDLPAGLHTLPSLKSLRIRWCPGISRLPETGLPLSLELLELNLCSKELADQCRLLATSKLLVVI
uniref:NB-ARC domain-containing protein n=1 Tax=Triticum urartu TaxID=4572 RepID=A0A8R7PKA4_TRIUA